MSMRSAAAEYAVHDLSADEWRIEGLDELVAALPTKDTVKKVIVGFFKGLLGVP